MYIMTDYLFGSIVGAGVMAILTIVNSYYERRIINKILKDLEIKLDKLIKSERHHTNESSHVVTLKEVFDAMGNISKSVDKEINGS